MQSFFSFAWPKEETDESPQTIPDEEKPRSWASVFENFREQKPSDETNSSVEAFRSFARRAHQLLERQQQRATQSRRAALHEESLLRERLSLALAEAEELEDLLKQAKWYQTASNIIKLWFQDVSCPGIGSRYKSIGIKNAGKTKHLFE